MLNYKKKNYFCQLDLGLEFIKRKWKALIICHLRNEPIRFLELQRRIEGIILRVAYPEVPPRVEYELTEKGRELLPILDSIEEWAEKYLDYCSI